MKRTTPRILPLVLLAFLLAVLAGCGSSDSSGFANPDTDNPAQDDNQQPQQVPTYTVGGQLEGLAAGNSVVLQLNGGYDLELNADGSFAFEAELNDGDSYQVSVEVQPADCDCSVEDGSGTISGADVNAVRVRCRSWNYPADAADNLSPDNYDAGRPQVALGGQQEALLVWRQRYDGHSGRYRIYKAEYRDGSWDLPEDISDSISPFASRADNPRVAMNGAGEAIIVWQQYDNGRWQIFMVEYRNGAWTDFNFPVRLSLSGQHAVNPQVAMDESGNAIVVWQQYDGGSPNTYQVYKAEYRNGTWNRPDALDDHLSFAGKHAYYPQVAMDESGNAIVVWQQQDSLNRWQVFKAEYRNGSWSLPQDLDDNISPDNINAYRPQVAMDESGNAIVVWQQRVSSLRQVVMLEYRQGKWSNFNYPEPVSPFGRNSDYQVQLAMDPDGAALIVWRQYDGANWQIYKAEYRNGTWNRPADAGDNISPDGQDAEKPQVAMDANGSALIVWRQYDGANWRIYKSEYRFASWTHPADLTADGIGPAGRDADSPRAAMSPAGDALIAWQGNDGANDQVYKAEYR